MSHRSAVCSEHDEKASLADVCDSAAPKLVAFFRAKGRTPAVAESLTRELIYDLAARAREALRNSSSQHGLDPSIIRIGDLKLDVARRLFWRGDDEIHLSPREFELLALMMKNSDAVLPHVKLLRSVWGVEFGGELKYLRNYVRALRKKIEKNPAEPEYIVSVPWVGYRFREPKTSRVVESETTRGSSVSNSSVNPRGWTLVKG